MIAVDAMRISVSRSEGFAAAPSRRSHPSVSIARKPGCCHRVLAYCPDENNGRVTTAANPLADLFPALEAIASHASGVVPATGQAILDLQRPDQDEMYDRVHLGPEAGSVLRASIESEPGPAYRQVQPVHRRERTVFRYFLDGSAHTYYLGNVIENERHSAVHLAQIGAAALRRDDLGRVHVADGRRTLLVMLDRSALSDALFEATADACRQVDPSGQRIRLLDSGGDDALTAGVQAAKEPRSRAAHRANWQMRLLERAIAASLAEGLAEGDVSEWLVVDGSLGNEYVTDWKHSHWAHIGVIKSTWKGMRFEIGTGRRREVVNIFRLLVDLPPDSRTLAFGLREGKLATWFVRLRGPDKLDFPLMGTLRVEMPNPSGEPIATELIDELSGALIAERTETPYGRDDRWHSHLYPIWLTERSITNSLFLTESALKAALRWPFAKILGGAA